MKPALLLFCALSIGLFPGCSGDKAQELIDTAQFEEQQHNLPHAKQLYDDVIRLYPDSKQAEVARARLAQLNSGQ
jgi:hypothetical protein